MQKSRLELEVEQLARERNALLKENSDLSSRFEQRVKNVEDKCECYYNINTTN